VGELDPTMTVLYYWADLEIEVVANRRYDRSDSEQG
jgi:hypothetical protein